MRGSVVWTALVVLTSACGSSPAAPAGESFDTVVASTESAEPTHGDGKAEALVEESSLSCDAEGSAQIATDMVDNLLARVVEAGASGDFKPAAELWTGFYAEDDSAQFLRRLVEHHNWLLDGELVIIAVDSYTDPRFCPGKVVGVTDVELRGAFAVLVDPTGTIQRIQRPENSQEAPEFTSSGVRLPRGPVEGSLVAYLWSERLSDEAITINRDGTTVIQFPTSNVKPELLIVSMATPELPTAYAVLVP